MDKKVEEHGGEGKVMDQAEAWQKAIPLVERIWAGVFETTDRMLKVHADFGFSQFEKQLNPNLATVLFSLKVLGQVLDTMYDSGGLEPDETRLVLNARQQILLVQRVAESLRANCEEDYNQAMDQMAKQAVF